jgi:mannose-6-phosphate isomerase-like protein (cupin superfamily)
VRNLATGETIEFTSADGDALEMDITLRLLGVPGGLAHRHRPSERFAVRSGALLAFVQGRAPRRIESGDAVEIPGGRWHMLVALKPSSAHVTVRPAMRFQELLTCAAAAGSGDIRPRTLRRLNALMAEHDCLPRLPGTPVGRRP